VEFAAPETTTQLSREVGFGFRSTSVSGLGAFAGFGATVLALAFSPKVSSQTFTPKFAVLLVFAAVGVVPLARLVRSSSPLRWPARAAVAFLVVALVSALLSPSPAIGILGPYLWGTGWLFWLGVAGAFAIGASLGPADRPWLVAGLLVGALGNAALAIFQIVTNSQGSALGLFDGTQADGALGNPIHLEALLLGGLALVLGRACRAPLRWGAAVLLLTIGLEFTFERFAIVVLVLLAAYAFYSYGVRRGGIFALLVGGGYAIAFLSGGSGLGSRVASGTGETTFGTRLRIWWQGAQYVMHHPLLGVGPGQLRTAMDSSATLSFYQHVLVGKVLTDGHDVFVEVAVTTGLLGLACFACWLLGAARLTARCGLLGFGAAIIGVDLVEPLNVAILPLAFLAIGAAATMGITNKAASASADPPTASSLAPTTRALPAREGARSIFPVIVTAVSLILALVLGVTMVVGDAYMFDGTNSGGGRPYNLAAAKEASRLMPYWPDSSLEVAQIEAFDSVTAPPSLARGLLVDSRHWAIVSLDRDAKDPRNWSLLANANVSLKQYRLARADFLDALSCDRWYFGAFQGLGDIDVTLGNWTEAAHWFRLGLETAVNDPVPSAQLRGLLARAERHLRSQEVAR
jgi:hypothetical protein